MASVFLSYDRDDAGKARALATALQKAGHSVWWDLHVRGGAQFSKAIEEALKAADAVVVLWSKHAIESAWVKDEAAAGRDSGRLVPVTIDGTEPPLGFRQFQTIEFTRWKGRAHSAHFKQLVDAIDSLAAVPAATPRASVAFGPSAIVRRSYQPRLIAIAVIGAILLAGALSIWQLLDRRSSIPVVVVAAADASPASQTVARDLLVKLGSLRSAKTDAVRLTAGSSDSSRADLIFEAAGSDDRSSPSATLALVTGNDRAVLWSKDFVTQGGNRTALEQSMAYTAGQVLDCALQANAPSQPRLEEQTLKLFLNGCALFGDRYRYDPASVVPIFSQVLAAAPKFQPAWSKLLLAEAQHARTQMAAYGRVEPGNLPEHIRRARKLNPKLPELYIAQAALLPLGALDQRLRLLDHAVQLNPDNPDLHAARGEHLSFIGRNNDAVEDSKRAAEIDPLSPGFRSNLIRTLGYAGQEAAAEEELRRAEQLWPASPTIEDARFRLHGRYGDAKDALRMLNSPDFRRAYPTRNADAFLKVRLNPTEANVQDAIAAAQSAQVPERWRQRELVQLLAEFGRIDQLYDMLTQLRPDELREISGVFYRPPLKKFRQDPRFMPLAARAGLVDFWRKSGKWPDFCFEPDLPYDCKKEAAKLGA